MRKLTVRMMWVMAFLMIGFVAGCGDEGRNSGAGNPVAPLTPPTVVSFTPPDPATPVCPNNIIIAATFSKPMNPVTINMSTFLVTGPNAASVTGQDSYVTATNVVQVSVIGFPNHRID